jgi:hypothetical protein
MSAPGKLITMGEWVATMNWEPSFASSWKRLRSAKQPVGESAASGSSRM